MLVEKNPRDVTANGPKLLQVGKDRKQVSKTHGKAFSGKTSREILKTKLRAKLVENLFRVDVVLDEEKVYPMRAAQKSIKTSLPPHRCNSSVLLRKWMENLFRFSGCLLTIKILIYFTPEGCCFLKNSTPTL